MNPRARRLRRLRRESFRRAWRSKSRRARLQAYISRSVAESLKGVVGKPNIEACSEAVTKACARFMSELQQMPGPIAIEVTSSPEALFRDGAIEITITMPVPPGFELVPVEE